MFFNSCYNRCNCCDNENEITTIIQGPTGATGATGPTGPTGATGTAINENATILNTGTETITSGTALTMPTTLTNNGLTIANNSVTVLSTGTYFVMYGVNSATGATDEDNVAIAINGTINTNTERALSTTDGISGGYVLNLNANDVITLVPTVTGATELDDIGGPSVFLTIIRIA